MISISISMIRYNIGMPMINLGWVDFGWMDFVYKGFYMQSKWVKMNRKKDYKQDGCKR